METKINQVQTYKGELSLALKDILSYWKAYTVDEIHGGFIGRISQENIKDETADKGSVLNARILWSFSAAYNGKATGDLELAERAYRYLTDHFLDKDYGGVYWSVDYKGDPKDDKKQVYASAFTLYAFSEYFMACGNEVVKDHAIALYHELVKYSYDQEKGGFFEAFNRQWEPLADLRLSDKDANEKKTMNTHLHVLEAFTNLYRIWPDPELKSHIIGLLRNFADHIINAETAHMILFFDENWSPKSEGISFGHDIEASWLLLEAAEVVEEEELIAEVKVLAIKMAQASLSGLDEDGGLWYEQESKDHMIKEKHWWVQAEAMIGFYNAWQLTNENLYITASIGCWNYVQKHLLDKRNGEWFWGIDEQGQLMANEDKVGIWKCPYHNSRACLELIKRIQASPLNAILVE